MKKSIAPLQRSGTEYVTERFSDILYIYTLSLTHELVSALALWILCIDLGKCMGGSTGYLAFYIEGTRQGGSMS